MDALTKKVEALERAVEKLSKPGSKKPNAKEKKKITKKKLNEIIARMFPKKKGMVLEPKKAESDNEEAK
jgi:hypothetical protein